MQWLLELGSAGWPQSGGPRLTLLAVVAALIAVDTLPLIGLAVPGDVAVIGVVTVMGACAGPSVILAVTAGSLVGWTVGYALGCVVRRREPRRRGWLARRLGSVDRVLAGRGERVLALAPFLPVVNALAPMAAGAAGLSLRRTLLFAGAGTLAWASLYTLIGMGGRAGLAGLGGSAVATFLPALVAVPVSALVAVIARRALRARPA
jgi:membrane protein DedA with SNARE-associated domain